MELNERETLIRIEQQLKDSVENQASIRRDLKEIFQRIETESKLVTSLSGDLKGHTENTKLRWNSLDQRLSTTDKTISSINDKTEKNEEAINQLKEDQSVLEGNLKTSVKATRWVLGIIASFGSLISVIAILLEALEK